MAVHTNGLDPQALGPPQGGLNRLWSVPREHDPPLRDRRVDIPLLAQHFVDELRGRFRKDVSGLTREALECLVEAPWPGNVRELRNAIEHALVLVHGERIGLLDLPAEVRSAREGLRTSATPAPTPSSPFPHLTPEQAAERATILSTLERTRWNRTLAAELLGTSRMTLWKKLKKYGLADASE